MSGLPSNLDASFWRDSNEEEQIYGRTDHGRAATGGRMPVTDCRRPAKPCYHGAIASIQATLVRLCE